MHEQLHKALDRKVWLPSGGSLVIERTEALTVIDVNTGKNVGTSNLEETVYRNNLEAAEVVARELRLRDIGGIIVIDFIDMEIKANREAVEEQFRQALARDKTRTQVFPISELGLLEMTRKRVSEGLVEAFSSTCPHCNGRGFVVDESMLEYSLIGARFVFRSRRTRPARGLPRLVPGHRRAQARTAGLAPDARAGRDADRRHAARHDQAPRGWCEQCWFPYPLARCGARAG